MEYLSIFLILWIWYWIPLKYIGEGDIETIIIMNYNDSQTIVYNCSMYNNKFSNKMGLLFIIAAKPAMINKGRR